MKEYVKSANPYMPLWEHIPDGEPRVFEHNGEKRVYLYGSHDTVKTEYCGPDYVVWSAPEDDLTDWKCHGICYESTDGSILYAPDVVKIGDTYYMYAAEQKGSVIMLAKSKTPWGPFTDPVKTELAFDPGILVDDDGKVYAYWGFCKSFAAELNDDYATIKKETLVENLIGHSPIPWEPEDDGHLDKELSFFEASSPRKINGKYVLIYSRRTQGVQPEDGVYEDCNGFLSYAYSDKPLSGYVRGGDISLNGGEIIEVNGRKEMTYKWGNNHGSLAEVKGKWYIFYHRHEGTDEFSRQAMIEPVEIATDDAGRIFIGKIAYENGKPVSSSPVEMTSQGANENGIDAFRIISAGYACHIYGGSRRAYIQPVYEKIPEASAPVTDITSGCTVGFRFLQFGNASPKKVAVNFKNGGSGKFNLRIDSRDGEIIGGGVFDASADSFTYNLEREITGKHAVYFEFYDCADTPVTFDRFTFD